MSFMGMIPQISIPAIEQSDFNVPVLAERFVTQLKNRLFDMQRELGEDEQLDVVAFLPSGKAITIEAVGYENPALVTVHGLEQETGKAYTVLFHQSSLQILVTVDKIPAGKSPRMVTFRAC